MPFPDPHGERPIPIGSWGCAIVAILVQLLAICSWLIGWDWELWACASKLVLDHQSAALGEALAKADQMLERGDEDGQTAWLAIAQRIIAIQSDGGTAH